MALSSSSYALAKMNEAQLRRVLEEDRELAIRYILERVASRAVQVPGLDTELSSEQLSELWRETLRALDV